jgi:hypothetical protein
MKVSGWILVGIAILCFGLWVRGNVFRGKAIEGALRGDSLEAAGDSTRRTFLRDHALQERRIVQHKLERDSLDKRLKRTTGLLADVKAQVRPLDTVLVGQVVEDSNNIRTARFQADRPPYHVDLTAVLPPPPQSGSLEGTIRLDPAVFSLRTQCGQAANGIRPATLLFSGPDWLQFTVVRAQQDPLYCNASILKNKHGSGYYVIRGAAATGVLALLAAVVF